MAIEPRALVDALAIGAAVDAKLDPLFVLLSEHLEKTPEESHIDFVGKSIDTVDGFIHYASEREHLERSLDWISGEADYEREEDAEAEIARLVLSEIIRRGLEKHRGDAKKRAAWLRMQRHLDATPHLVRVGD